MQWYAKTPGTYEKWFAWYPVEIETCEFEYDEHGFNCRKIKIFWLKYVMRSIKGNFHTGQYSKRTYKECK